MPPNLPSHHAGRTAKPRNEAGNWLKTVRVIDIKKIAKKESELGYAADKQLLPFVHNRHIGGVHYPSLSSRSFCNFLHSWRTRSWISTSCQTSF